MKKAFLFVLFLLVWELMTVYDVQAGAPKIQIPQASWDFGYVPAGGVVSHSYLVKNMGNDVLRIQNIKPG